MSARVKIGDIVEIPLSKGFAYAQYTHRSKGMGYVIRILDGIDEQRPKDFFELALKEHKFVTIFPLVTAINQKLMTVVGNTVIPEAAREFPLFRAAGGQAKDGKILDWWLWDGEESWRVGDLKPEQYKLPIKSIPSHPVLVEMIEEDWRPETDPWRGYGK